MICLLVITSTKVIKNYATTKDFSYYFDIILLVINTLCVYLSINIHPLAVFYRLGGNSLHDERKRSPGQFRASCGHIYGWHLECTSLKTFLIKNETVSVPSEDLDTLSVSGKEDKNVTT